MSFTWYCFICGEVLGPDEVYGTDEMDLCRYHHEKYFELLNFMIRTTGDKPAPEQLGLFPRGDE